MSLSIPHWLEEHCHRLSTNDVDLMNLNLNIRRVDADMMEVLAVALQNNHLLQTLNLTSSLMNDPAALIPFSNRVMPYHASLRVLHLSYNELTDVTCLGVALRTNTILAELYLDYNWIGDDSAVVIAEAIDSHSSLRVLNLNSNSIGDRGASALGEMIGRAISPLRRLSLTNNEIGKTGADALYNGLLSNDRIKDVCLDKNDSIPDKLLQYIQYLTHANRNGRYLLKRDSNDVPTGLWPHVLARVREKPGMIYFFLTSKPELMAWDRKK